jgi:hypothetical protein
MGFVSDFVNDVFGGGDNDAIHRATQAQNDAAVTAIETQKDSTDKIIEAQEAALAQARSDLQPFRQAGEAELSGLTSLVTDPNAQLAFIEDNPFFDSLAKRATDTLFSSTAAGGKAFSGGTAEALQTSMLLLGTDLLNQNINQRQNIVNTGANAAAGQATATQNTAGITSSALQNNANNVSNLLTQQGNVRAANQIGINNANVQGSQNLLNAGLSAAALALCDINAKENIKHVGFMNNGLPLYKFNYKGDNETHINVMAQDVEKLIPEAVIEFNGLKHVNMEAICH